MQGQETSIEAVKNYLNQKGINPSYQRLRIFELLSSGKNHPTADLIYNTLIREIPTLSKTTVYNTLNLFQKRGIVTGLTIDENEVRYEANTKPHAHFKCTSCGAIIDMPIDCPYLAEKFVDGNKVTERHLYLKGICSACMKMYGMTGQ